MRSADKVTVMDTLHRTYLVAFAAAGTLIVIYSSEVVFNLYCAVRTVLFALSAGDTSVQTYLTHLSTFVVT